MNNLTIVYLTSNDLKKFAISTKLSIFILCTSKNFRLQCFHSSLSLVQYCWEWLGWTYTVSCIKIIHVKGRGPGRWSANKIRYLGLWELTLVVLRLRKAWWNRTRSRLRVALPQKSALLPLLGQNVGRSTGKARRDQWTTVMSGPVGLYIE